MDTRILHKRSGTSGSVPPSNSLEFGELAVNYGVGDGTVYHKDASGSVKPIRAGSAVSASYALTASYAMNGGGGGVSSSYAATASIATSASYALTASYAMNGGGGGVSSSYAVTASHAITALTASYAMNGGGGGGGTTTWNVLGLPDRRVVSITTPSLATNEITTGSVQLAKGFILHQVQTSYPARVRLYVSSSFRNADINRPITGTISGEHGLILDLVTSGSPSFLTYSLSPIVFGSDGSPSPSGSIAYSITNLHTTPVEIETIFNINDMESSGTVDVVPTASYAITASFALNLATVSSPPTTSLLAWYAPDSIVNSGSIVTQWSDKSGNNNHLYALLTGFGPTFATGSEIFNGYNVVRLNNTSGSFLSCSLSTPHTGSQLNVVFVIQHRSLSSNYGRIISLNSASIVDWNNIQSICMTVNSSGRTLRVDRNSVSADITDLGYGYPIIYQCSVPTTLETYGLPLTVWQNGVKVGEITQYGSFNITDLALGASAASPTPVSNGIPLVDIAEILIYNRHLTYRERLNVERYLASKYDVATAFV
jgi:hypothetical protein